MLTLANSGAPALLLLVLHLLYLPVQVLLRWALQYGVAAVCEASGKDIDRANVGVFDWELSDKDFKKLSNIRPS